MWFYRSIHPDFKGLEENIKRKSMSGLLIKYYIKTMETKQTVLVLTDYVDPIWRTVKGSFGK